MKKKVHKKTTVRDGKEETIVTTDTHVEHDDKGPEDLQAAMKEIIDNFVEVKWSTDEPRQSAPANKASKPLRHESFSPCKYFNIGYKVASL